MYISLSLYFILHFHFLLYFSPHFLFAAMERQPRFAAKVPRIADKHNAPRRVWDAKRRVIAASSYRLHVRGATQHNAPGKVVF